MALDPPPVLEWTGAITFLMFAFIVQLNGPVKPKKMRRMYKQEFRPVIPYAPPGWLFGIAWFFLYMLMFVTGYITWLYRQDFPDSMRYNAAMALFVASVLLNMVWTPLFFKMRWYWLAFVDIVLMILAGVAFSLVLLITWGGPATIAIGFLFLLYVAWIVYAGYMNLMVALRLGHDDRLKKRIDTIRIN